MNARHSLTIFLALVLSSATPAVTQAEEILFEDNFATLDPGWGDPTEMLSVKENKLVVTSPVGMSQCQLNQALLFEDADIQVKARLAKGEGTAQEYFGLVFWGEGYDSYYCLTISQDGRVGVLRRSKGRWLFPVAYRAHDAIKKGVGEWNDLRVTTKGPNAAIFVNGQQVAAFKGQPPQGGGFIGVRAESGSGSPAVGEFSDLKLTKP